MINNVQYESIIDYLFYKFGENSISQINIFGSNIYLENHNKDIDILIIRQQNSDYDQKIINRFDISIISSKKINTFIVHLDPLAIEPIITGKNIYVKNNFHLEEIPTIDNSLQICEYLINRSKIYYNWTTSSLGGYQNLIEQLNTNNIMNILLNLSFVASYLLYSLHYSVDSVVITFNELIKKYPSSIVKIIMDQKHNPNPDISIIKNIVNKIENTFNNNTKIDWVSDYTFVSK